MGLMGWWKKVWLKNSGVFMTNPKVLDRVWS